jgi:hypothetical protein
MKKINVTILIAVFLLTSCSTLNKLGLQPSALETIMAVKEVMNSSTFKALRKLEKLNSEGVNAVIPADLQPALGALKALGYEKEIEQVTKVVGDASAIALKESGAIFADAIKEVDLGDAVAIVVGGEDAATAVLKNAMKASVKKRYSANLDAQLSKSDATKYWPIAAGAYNVFAKNKVDTKLSDFVAEATVDAVFFAMGKEEAEIRKDPVSLGSAVVTKVWDYYSKRQAKKQRI